MKKYMKVIENFIDGEAHHEIIMTDEMPEGILDPVVNLVNEQENNAFYRDFFAKNGRDFDPIKDRAIYAARFA